MILSHLQRGAESQPLRGWLSLVSCSYAHAVAKACKRGNVPHWSPNQLRHTAATQIETEFGREDARCVLGHSTPTTTAIYAEWVERAAKVAAKRG